MARWVIHLKDGKTLTDADCFPHEVAVMEKLGYSVDDVTSVERIVRGKHLSIAKSRFIDTFFVATEEGIDMKMLPGRQLPPQVTKRILGCYVKNTEPPLQVRLIMDPRTFDTRLHIFRVRRKSPIGINAKPVNPRKKREVVEEFTRQIIDNIYSIVKTPDIKSASNTPLGLSCLLKKPKIRAELIIRQQNVLLGFTQTDQKLKPVFSIKNP